jgi:hypothetical protein
LTALAAILLGGEVVRMGGIGARRAEDGDRLGDLVEGLETGGEFAHDAEHAP